MKRIATFFGVLLGGIAVFFLSTFFFLAVRGRLDESTLVRIPWIGPLFEGSGSAEGRKEKLLALEKIQVNLGGVGESRRLRGQFAVGLEGNPGSKARYAIQDAIIGLCRRKSVEEIDSDRDLSALKREVAAAVEQALFSRGEGRVTEVFVSEFLVE